MEKTHASVTVTVVRDRKIRTALRTNQIVGFVTVPAWKKINKIMILPVKRANLSLDGALMFFRMNKLQSMLKTMNDQTP